MALISAHRGACGTEGLALADSYERAIRLGVDYVELDARRTLDGEYVIHHDPFTPAGRLIAGLTAREYRAATGDQALSVPELVSLARGRVRLHLDLKEVGDEAAVLDLVLPHLGPDGFVVTTLEDESVRRVRALHPGVRVGLSLGRDLAHRPPWQAAAVRLSELYPDPRVRACRPEFLAVHRRLAGAGLLRYCARRSLPAWVWTVDAEPEMGSLLADPRTAVLITNRPDLALGLRAATPAAAG